MHSKEDFIQGCRCKPVTTGTETGSSPDQAKAGGFIVRREGGVDGWEIANGDIEAGVLAEGRPG